MNSINLNGHSFKASDINRNPYVGYYLKVSKKSLTWHELRLMHRTFGNLGMTISIHYRKPVIVGTHERTCFHTILNSIENIIICEIVQMKSRNI